MTSREFSRRGDQRYEIRYQPAGVVFQVERLRRERHELIGELLVSVGDAFPDARTVEGLVSVGDFNFSSVQARSTRAKLIAERAGSKEMDWFGLLEEFCVKVIRAERQGPSPVDLRSVPEDDEKETADTWDVNGFPVLQSHPMILFGDGSCVAGDTMIQGPWGAARIDALAANGEPVDVWTLTPSGVDVMTTDGPPTRKGMDHLFEVEMASGRRVSVTRKHRFLTDRGWAETHSLVAGDVLAVSAHDARLTSAASSWRPLQDSSLAACLSTRAGGDPRSERTLQGSLGRYSAYPDPCDGRLLSVAGTGQGWTPLQAGVAGLVLGSSREDALGRTPGHNRIGQRPPAWPSQADVWLAAAESGVGAWPSRSHSDGTREQHSFHRAFDAQTPSGGFDQWEAVLAGDLFAASEKDSIKSISYVGYRAFYDLSVPVFENYLANGIWHHNSGKSYLAMYIAGSLAEVGVKTLYCDWEFSMAAHRTRFRRMFRPEPAGVYYMRCERPMREEADKITRVMKQHDIGYVICDSVGYACDGRPEEAERANEYFRAVRAFGVGSLHLAHITKGNQNSDEKPQGPIGSVFWRNGARSVWLIEAAKENPGGQLRFGLYHKKNNLGQLLAPRAYTLTFSDKATTLTQAKVQDIDELAASLPVIDRMRKLLLSGPMTPKDVADELNLTQGAVRATVSRHQSAFVRIGKKIGVKSAGDLEF